MITSAEIRAAIAARPELAPLVAARLDHEIAAALSVGRTRSKSLLITERGVRENLSVVEGAQFLKVLRELNEATVAPTWLDFVLTGMGVPADQQWAYFDTLQCGWTWLCGQGLDVGTSKVRSMLDLITAGNPGLASACGTLKALGIEPDPISTNQVSDALNEGGA